MFDGEPPLTAYGTLHFERTCPKCCRFVKADKVLEYEENGEGMLRFQKPNATCKKHGRVNMPFVGDI